MSERTSFLNDRNLIVIGRRFNSDIVALEASEAAARWLRDEAALAGYGFGIAVRTRYEEDRTKHEALRVSRSQAVATKRKSYASRDAAVSAAWAWVDRVKSALEVEALTDDKLSADLDAAEPRDDAGLEAGIQALARLLTTRKDRLGSDAQVAERLAETSALVAGLSASPGLVHTNSSQTITDTAQIDLLDGKLCVWIRQLNKAGRRAIRNGHLQAPPQDYVFHHLKNSGRGSSPQPAPEPVPPPTPVS
jgi:hypothetical protein